MSLLLLFHDVFPNILDLIVFAAFVGAAIFIIWLVVGFIRDFLKKKIVSSRAT